MTSHAIDQPDPGLDSRSNNANGAAATIASAIRREELLAEYRDGLLYDTLPFWLPLSVDRQCGGFLTARDRDGSLLDDDKGLWQQGRFSWLLGELHNTVEPRDEWRDLCRHGLDFVTAHGFDPSDGRMWFHVTRQGQPIRKRRYAFTESFAAIAYGEYAQATRSDEAAQKARQTFQAFLEHSRSPQKVQPKFTNVRPLRGLGVPMISIFCAQELRASIGLENADELIDESIDAIERLHVNHALRAVLETVELDGTLSDHFDGRTLNPGHAFEAAWFIMHEGKLRGDHRLVQLGATMLDYTWARGWDDAYGGILYFVDVFGKPVQEYWHDMKFWWPHNEAIIAALLAYQLTGDDKYARWHGLVHDWAYQRFPDRLFGEWYGYLHRDGSLSATVKGNMWKGPFHLPRMQLVCWRILEEMRGAAVTPAVK